MPNKFTFEKSCMLLLLLLVLLPAGALAASQRSMGDTLLS
jgi:hypothetical protein